MQPPRFRASSERPRDAALRFALNSVNDLAAKDMSPPLPRSQPGAEQHRPAQKVIFVNRFFYPDESATSQLLTDLCLHLAQAGWKVSVVTSKIPTRGAPFLRDRPDPEGVGVVRVWSTMFGRKSLLGRIVDYLSFYPGALIALLRITDPGDIIVVKTDPPMVTVIAAFAAKLRRAKLINWLQDLYPEVAIALGVRFLKGPIGSTLIALRNACLRRAHANVVIGARMADRLTSYGISAGRVHLLPNWSDEAAITPIRSSSSSSRQEWGLSDNTFVFGYSGNFGRAHESETILRAAELLKHRSDIIFLFVGGGHESRHLQQAVEDAGLKNFLFKPHQPRERLSDSLGAADAHWLSLRPELEGLIVPSKFYGIASAGRPVIAVASKDGEIARAISELGCGYVVEPGDASALAEAISELADSSGRRHRLGERARAGANRTFARRLALRRWIWILERTHLEHRKRKRRGGGARTGPLERFIEELNQLQQ